jgi:hypothetical protein
MCRWLAYSGSPIQLEDLLVTRDRSLIDQSLDLVWMRVRGELPTAAPAAPAVQE